MIIHYDMSFYLITADGTELVSMAQYFMWLIFIQCPSKVDMVRVRQGGGLIHSQPATGLECWTRKPLS